MSILTGNLTIFTQKVIWYTYITCIPYLWTCLLVVKHISTCFKPLTCLEVSVSTLHPCCPQSRKTSKIIIHGESPEFWHRKMSNCVSQIKYFWNPNICCYLYFYEDIHILLSNSFIHDKSSLFSKNKQVVQTMLLLRDCIFMQGK